MMLTYRASVIELLSGSWPADGSAPICWWECSHLLVGVLPVKGSHILIIFYCVRHGYRHVYYQINLVATE